MSCLPYIVGPSVNALDAAIQQMLADMTLANGTHVAHTDPQLANAPANILRSSIDAHSIAASKLTAHITNRIAHLQANLNDHALINLPPLAIRSQIFAHVIGDDHQSLTRLRTLGAVSKTWKQDIIDSPNLWTSVGTGGNRTWVPMALTLSALLPLHIHLKATDFDHIDSQLPIFTKSVVFHTKRWSLLSLEGIDIHQIEPFLLSPCPALLTLIIERQIASREQRLRTLCQFAALKHLSLRLTALLWQPPTLQGLKSLHLVGIKTGCGMGLSWLLENLIKSPLLTRLQLEDVAFREFTLDADPTFVHLPYLKYLELSLLTLSATHSLVESIQGAALKTLRVRVQAFGATEQEDLLSLISGGTSLHGYILATLTAPTSRSATFVISSQAETPVNASNHAFAELGVYLELGGIPVDLGLVAIRGLLPEQPLPSINMHVYGDVQRGTRASPVGPTLLAMPSLRSLHLHGTTSAIAILNGLSRPQSAQGYGRKAWACRQLVDVGFSAEVVADETVVLNFVKQRFRAGGQIDLPAKFESITMHDQDNSSDTLVGKVARQLERKAIRRGYIASPTTVVHHPSAKKNPSPRKKRQGGAAPKSLLGTIVYDLIPN